MNSRAPLIFSERLQRLRSAVTLSPETSHPLQNLVADALQIRLQLVRKRFKNILIIGNPPTDFVKALVIDGATVVQNQVEYCASSLPFAENTFDLVISFLHMHLMNDVPGFLAQVNNCLQPDGLFLGAFFGGESLYEMREVITEIELKHTQGLAQRFHPSISSRDGGYLLQRAKFALPVADFERHTITYTSLTSLKNDLRSYGQNNSLNSEIRPLSRALYHNILGQFPIDITADIIYLSGWAPSLSQPKPAIRGSGKISLIDVL